MAFDPEKCYIPTVYCGNADQKYPYFENNNKYLRTGTPFECMKKGFGAATAIENKKKVASTSLQQIRYVGPYFEQSFYRENIRTLSSLLTYVRTNTPEAIEAMLSRVFRNKNGSPNTRGINSTLLYLYRNGNSRLPPCREID